MSGGTLGSLPRRIHLRVRAICRLANVRNGCSHGRVCRRAQGGSLLLELMIVIALLMLMAVWASHEWARHVRDLQARSLAVWMQQAQEAAAAYLHRHGGDMAQASHESGLMGLGYANWQLPAWSELRAAGLLPSGWLEHGPLQQSLGLRVVRQGSCPGQACHLFAIVHTNGPLVLQPGRVDEDLIAQWLQAAQGHGLVVWSRHPEYLAGAGQRLAVPVNAGWQAGTVALAARWPTGGEASGGTSPGLDLEEFLKVRDARDPDFQGNATVRGNVRSASRLIARDSLELETAWHERQSCSPEGSLGRTGSGPGLLMCQDGRWRLVAKPLGGGYMFNSKRGCFNSGGVSTANPNTLLCSCPENYSQIQVAESGRMDAAEGLTMGFLCVPM